MQELIIDLINLILSFGIGALIGEEREIKGKPIGVRTMSILCVASTFAIIVTQKHMPGDIPRVIAGIITGIGFLGAGSIIAHQGNIKGLTTAASSWAIVIIGIGIGMREYILSLAAAAILYLVLEMGKDPRHG